MLASLEESFVTHSLIDNLINSKLIIPHLIRHSSNASEIYQIFLKADLRPDFQAWFKCRIFLRWIAPKTTSTLQWDDHEY